MIHVPGEWQYRAVLAGLGSKDGGLAMRNGDRRYSTLLIAIGLTCVGLVLWVGLLLYMWLILQAAAVRTDFWAMTEALSTAVAAAAVLGAGFVAYRELGEVASSRHMEIADRLFEELNSAECIEARRWVYHNLAGDPEAGIRSLTPEGRAAVKKVLNSLDRIAFLTQSEWIPIELVMPWINPMIVKAWAKLAPYVEYESHRRKEPDYYAYARELAGHCIAWRAENLRDAETRWLDDAL
jgi:hypothetical protein